MRSAGSPERRRNKTPVIPTEVRSVGDGEWRNLFFRVTTHLSQGIHNGWAHA